MDTMTDSDQVTRVLAELAGGNEDAAETLLPLVYDELRTLADRYLRNESGGKTTLQPTALVHEAYLRMLGAHAGNGRNRRQFFAVAARAMRHLLIDHARRRGAAKRGGGRIKLSIEDISEPSLDRADYLVALDDALTELAAIDPDLGRLIELRFFAGLTVDETAQVLDIGTATVKRRWRLAKGWLHRQITNCDDEEVAP